jgi:STE24 endopeptidase
VASAIRWPVAWYRQFHLETQFGFNTMTGRLWWTDRLKSSLIGAVLAFLLALMLLGSMRVGGAFWWFWAWLGCLAAGVLLPLLLPSVILPWFNRFEPLSQGALRDRLLALAQRSGFPSRDILVTDGSRRSKHANAYLTGLGRSRRAVLFDTLLARLEEPEVEAVLAHEIAHHRCRHPQKGLALSALVALAALAVLSALRKQPGLSAAFGFSPGDDTALLVIAGFLAGSVLFWLAPLFNLWSRRQEFQADALAARWMGSPDPLVQALRKLTACNLDPLAPHPLYRAFHHSHPTLPEREQALRG